MFENYRMIFGKLVDMDSVITEATAISGDRPSSELVMALTMKAIAEKQQIALEELKSKIFINAPTLQELEDQGKLPGVSNVVDLNSVRNIRDANESIGEIVEFMNEGVEIKTREQFEQDRQMIAQLNKDITLGGPEECDSYDVYLTKGDEIIGLHAIGYAGLYNYTVHNLDKSIETKSSDFEVLESWGNSYDEDHNMLGRGSFRIHSHDLEETAKEYEAEGWTRRAKPGKIKP